MRFIDPDGRSAMDTMTQLGGNWTNVGYGYFNAELGKYIDYEGNIMTPAQVQKARSYLDGGGGGGVAGGGTNDSSLSPWMQVNIGGGGNFSKFDFTQFGADEIIDEEPVNFFGNNKQDKEFRDRFEQQFRKFKNTKGDGIFRVYGHGDTGMIWNGEDMIWDAKTFDKVMGSKNSNWDKVDNYKNPILFLYSCLSGFEFEKTGKLSAFARKISKAHPNLTVIGFDSYVDYGYKNSGMSKINYSAGTGDGNGYIVIFKNGEIIHRELFKNYIK